MIFNMIWLIIGLVLAAIFLVSARRLGAVQEMRVIGFALIIAALIYVGFSLVWGDTIWLYIELGGVLVYGLFVWMALRYSPIWLAIGWGLHPLWDLALHLFGPGHAVVPAWYAMACLSFDLLVAGYVLYRISEDRSPKYDADLLTN